MYLPTCYVLTYLHIYILTYLPVMYLPTNIPTYLLTYIPTYLIPTYLHTYLDRLPFKQECGKYDANLLACMLLLGW